MDEIEDQEFYSKRILLKIYKERALMKPCFDRGAFKENFRNAYNEDEDIVSFRKKMTTVEQEEKEIKATIEAQKKDDASLEKDVELQKLES